MDYLQGSILEHHLKSHMWSLHLQVKHNEYAISQLDETLSRDEDIVKGEVKSPMNSCQDLFCSDHVNDFIQVMYRFELLGEGMGDRWSRVSSLLEKTKKELLTPMDYVHRGILFSVTGDDTKLRELLSDEKAKERDDMWKQLDLPETKIKWCHVNGDDRMDTVSKNDMIHQTINALIQLNSVSAGKETYG